MGSVPVFAAVVGEGERWPLRSLASEYGGTLDGRTRARVRNVRSAEHAHVSDVADYPRSKSHPSVERASNITVGMFVHVENEEELTNVVQPAEGEERCVCTGQHCADKLEPARHQDHCRSGEEDHLWEEYRRGSSWSIVRDGREGTCGQCLRVWRWTETSCRLVRRRREKGSVCV